MKTELNVNGHNIFDWLEYKPDGTLVWLKTPSSKAVKGSIAGWKDKDGYIVVTFNGKKIRASRLIWYMHHGYMPEQHIDHINNLITDNRIENLREASSQQNSCNRGKQSNNTSGFKGCTFSKGKWQVMITVNKKPHYIGRFLLLEQASFAYEQAAKKLHGEFANVG